MRHELPKPDLARNMRLIGHSDQGRRPDDVQIMVANGHAFIGHMFSKGFSVVDVRDPPHAVNGGCERSGSSARSRAVLAAGHQPGNG
jgi:hypothetical protein